METKKKKKKKKGTGLHPSRPVPPTFKLDTDAGAKHANSQLVQDRAGRQGAVFSLSPYQACLLPTTAAVRSQRVKVGSAG